MRDRLSAIRGQVMRVATSYCRHAPCSNLRTNAASLRRAAPAFRTERNVGAPTVPSSFRRVPGKKLSRRNVDDTTSSHSSPAPCARRRRQGCSPPLRGPGCSTPPHARWTMRADSVGAPFEVGFRSLPGLPRPCRAPCCHQTAGGLDASLCQEGRHLVARAALQPPKPPTPHKGCRGTARVQRVGSSSAPPCSSHRDRARPPPAPRSRPRR